MVKKIISVATAFLMLCCMVPFYAFAESATCPKCGKDTLITNQDISIEIGEEVGLPLSLKRAYCSNCHYAKYEYNVLGVAGEQAYDDGDESHIINFLKSLKEQLLGKNATATKFESGGGSTDGSGVGRPKGYSDNNVPDVSQSGQLHLYAPVVGWRAASSSSASSIFSLSDYRDYKSADISGEDFNPYMGSYVPFVVCSLTAPVNGTYTVKAGSRIGCYSYLSSGRWCTSYGDIKKDYSEGLAAGKTYYFYVYVGGYGKGSYVASGTGVDIYVTPLSFTLKNQTNITINNNTWNGNIYTDNSTNLTYIYPQYTTINEKNETVTNISNTPIIYNNETKQYYTYDQTTKNYYYITYNAPPTPSPSPTPAPTEKPGGSISTPETGKPGGDAGDTTGILAVLVEIRDNMIQGFLDIKAAFVAGFAELSANFTLAIENLNVNIQNTFNKKFPDQSTPETAQPTPTPSPEPTETPSPTDPPLSTPSPSPAPTGKPDSGGDINNFWNIFIGGGSDDGTDGDHKGIFWALVSLILALIAFFTNLFAGVAYLFPFLPEGVVMTLNTCLFVVFLFVIIKFIMRSK